MYCSNSPSVSKGVRFCSVVIDGRPSIFAAMACFFMLFVLTEHHTTSNLVSRYASKFMFSTIPCDSSHSPNFGFAAATMDTMLGRLSVAPATTFVTTCCSIDESRLLLSSECILSSSSIATTPCGLIITNGPPWGTDVLLSNFTIPIPIPALVALLPRKYILFAITLGICLIVSDFPCPAFPISSMLMSVLLTSD